MPIRKWIFEVCSPAVARRRVFPQRHLCLISTRDQIGQKPLVDRCSQLEMTAYGVLFRRHCVVVNRVHVSCREHGRFRKRHNRLAGQGQVQSVDRCALARLPPQFFRQVVSIIVAANAEIPVTPSSFGFGTPTVDHSCFFRIGEAFRLFRQRTIAES